MSYFIDSQTGVIKLGFKDRLKTRMMELGIYSLTDLGRRINLATPTSIGERVNRLDAYAVAANKQHAKFKSALEKEDA